MYSPTFMQSGMLTSAAKSICAKGIRVVVDILNCFLNMKQVQLCNDEYNDIKISSSHLVWCEIVDGQTLLGEIVPYELLVHVLFVSYMNMSHTYR